MRLCSMLEKFSFKQFFKHRKSYIRVLQTRRETVHQRVIQILNIHFLLDNEHEFGDLGQAIIIII